MGHALRVVAVVCLLVIAAQVALAGTKDNGVTPEVGIHLLPGYGLSITPRPGYIRVVYRHRTWWVSPADIVPQPCVKTYVQPPDRRRVCVLDQRDGAWVQ